MLAVSAVWLMTRIADADGFDVTFWVGVFTASVMLGSTAPRYLPAPEVGLFAPVETIFASLWAYLAFSEALTATTWIGGAIVLAALLRATSPQQQSA
jgi:drug/metabolite transporter (DMT)-like permease